MKQENCLWSSSNQHNPASCHIYQETNFVSFLKYQEKSSAKLSLSAGRNISQSMCDKSIE